MLQDYSTKGRKKPMNQEEENPIMVILSVIGAMLLAVAMVFLSMLGKQRD